MTTASYSTRALLGRAAVMAGILAIIAGILGMHVMTGTHSMSSIAGAGIQQGAADHERHAADSYAAADIPPAQSTSATPSSSCLDAGTCMSMSASDGTCIPSPGNTSLCVPLPGSTPATLQGHYTSVAAIEYTYTPGTPSPGELSVSRT